MSLASFRLKAIRVSGLRRSTCTTTAHSGCGSTTDNPQHWASNSLPTANVGSPADISMKTATAPVNQRS